MRPNRLVLAAVLLTAPLCACGAKSPATAPASAPTAASADHGAQGDGSTGGAAPASAAPGTCHVRPGPLPDPKCTPGVLNPNVSQDNIAATVCRSGWTATIRPPAAYTNRLKRQQIAAYGYKDSAMADYEEDHLISLELGGSPTDPRNLWPEFPHSPNPKDKVENDLHRAICSHRITLAAAQKAIATDWTTAEHTVGIG